MGRLRQCEKSQEFFSDKLEENHCRKKWLEEGSSKSDQETNRVLISMMRMTMIIIIMELYSWFRKHILIKPTQVYA